jgi:HAD superfamily hydrolase (TIGR01549 family)
MKTTLFFDLDNTLYEEKDPKVAAETAVILPVSRDHGLDPATVHRQFEISQRAAMKAHAGLPAANNRDEWFDHMLQALSVSGKSQPLTKIYWDTVYARIEPYADATAVIPELAQAYKLYIISEEFPDILKEKLARTGLAPYFTGTISAPETGRLKPDARVFSHALSIANAQPGECVMVGDYPQKDVVGAKRAGITSVFLRRGKYYFYEPKDDERPDHTISSFFELPGLLSRL